MPRAVLSATPGSPCSKGCYPKLAFLLEALETFWQKCSRCRTSMIPDRKTLPREEHPSRPVLWVSSQTDDTNSQLCVCSCDPLSLRPMACWCFVVSVLRSLPTQGPQAKAGAQEKQALNTDKGWIRPSRKCMENTRTAFLSQGEDGTSARMWPRDLQSEAQEAGDMGRSSWV